MDGPHLRVQLPVPPEARLNWLSLFRPTSTCPACTLAADELCLAVRPRSAAAECRTPMVKSMVFTATKPQSWRICVTLADGKPPEPSIVAPR
jgi:hypothetical protein